VLAAVDAGGKLEKIELVLAYPQASGFLRRSRRNQNYKTLHVISNPSAMLRINSERNLSFSNRDRIGKISLVAADVTTGMTKSHESPTQSPAKRWERFRA
jgi:hypothetical protein